MLAIPDQASEAAICTQPCLNAECSVTSIRLDSACRCCRNALDINSISSGKKISIMRCMC